MHQSEPNTFVLHLFSNMMFENSKELMFFAKCLTTMVHFGFFKAEPTKKRSKKLQSQAPQTPILVRGKVFKSILRESKRKPKLEGHQKPTINIPSVPQPLSPKTPGSRIPERCSRDKTPEHHEMSRTPLLRRSIRLKES